MYQEGTQATQVHSVRSVHNEHATQYTASERSSQSYNSPHYRTCLTQNVAAMGMCICARMGTLSWRRGPSLWQDICSWTSLASYLELALGWDLCFSLESTTL